MDDAEHEDTSRLHSRRCRETADAGQAQSCGRDHDAEGMASAVTAEAIFDAFAEDPRTLHLLKLEHGSGHLLC